MNTSRHPVEALIQSGDYQQLRGLTPSTVGDYLNSVVDEYVRAVRPMNADALLSLGVRLAKAGFGSLSKGVLQRPLAQDRELGIDVFGMLLTGLWTHAFNSEAPELDDILALIALRGDAPLGIEAEYSYIQALCRASRSDSSEAAKAVIVPRLEEIERRSYPDPLDRQIRAMTSAALARTRSSLEP